MTVLHQGQWNWPSATDFDIQEIISGLSDLSSQQADSIAWRLHPGKFTAAGAVAVLHPPSPHVLWHRLLGGKFKIPRHNSILWLALLERLSTMDRPWVPQQNIGCVLCNGVHNETHDHLFFKCTFSARCISVLKRYVRFRWMGLGWHRDTLWASKKWRGKHMLHAAARAMLASMVHNIWRERNNRRFLDTASSAESVALKAIEEVRCRIIGTDIQSSLQLNILYRIWKIPWIREDAG
ncbi:UNVERIFIED_CONTAM: hypothetical protein Slati_0390900 [Sesamum latifolium]|uniref:Reverse transcriptase zinc-binding domain-containing protein n=1 Tax=Sesamum latifolium TaxID=2727402 RepID=A0AAW2XXE7_9LAMI